MQNKTVYTYDLLLKLNLIITVKVRKGLMIISFLSAVFAALNLADGIREKNRLDACLGTMCVALCLMCLVYSVIWSKGNVKKMLRKAAALDPDPTVIFDFEEECVRSERISLNAHLFSETAYCTIESIGLMDDTSCYVKLKTGSYLILQEKQGILPLCCFLVGKTGASPVGTAKKGPRLWTVRNDKAINAKGRERE